MSVCRSHPPAVRRAHSSITSVIPDRVRVRRCTIAPLPSSNTVSSEAVTRFEFTELCQHRCDVVE